MLYRFLNIIIVELYKGSFYWLLMSKLLCLNLKSNVYLV